MACSQRLLLDLLLQPFSDSITNTFLWKAGELFLTPLTHSCNQSIAWPRVCQDLWGNPPPTQLGFCSSLIGMARCCSLVTQRCVNCVYYLGHLCAEINTCGLSAVQELKGVMNTSQDEVQTRHQPSHTQVDLSSHEKHVRTAQDFAADLLKYISIFSSVAPALVAQQLQTAKQGLLSAPPIVLTPALVLSPTLTSTALQTHCIILQGCPARNTSL